MARKYRKKTTTKQDRIFALLRENPDLTATDAVKALARQGVPITKQAFYASKSMLKKRGMVDLDTTIQQADEPSNGLVEQLSMLQQDNQRLRAVIKLLIN